MELYPKHVNPELAAKQLEATLICFQKESENVSQLRWYVSVPVWECLGIPQNDMELVSSFV